MHPSLDISSIQIQKVCTSIDEEGPSYLPLASHEIQTELSCYLPEV